MPFWALNVLFISQVLEVVRNGKEIAFFFYPFYENYGQINLCLVHKVLKWNPNPDTLIIPQSKNDKILVLVKSSFLAMFVHLLGKNLIKMHWWQST